MYSCLMHTWEMAQVNATMVAPLLLTSGLVRYEAVFHSCRTSPVREYQLATVCSHGDFIVLPPWDFRALAP